MLASADEPIRFPASSSWAASTARGWLAWEEERFTEIFSVYPQYEKDEAVRPLAKKQISTGEMLIRMRTSMRNLLLFTNEQENPAFMEAIHRNLSFPLPNLHRQSGNQTASFQVFSAGGAGSSYPIHKHGASHLLQLQGRKVWWFWPPSTRALRPKMTNACAYLKQSSPPAGATVCLQQPGDLIWFPRGWYHATCTPDAWNIAMGGQEGRPSLTLPALQTSGLFVIEKTNPAAYAERHSRRESLPGGAIGGSLDSYYNSLFEVEKGKYQRRSVQSLAVHRWLGANHSTVEHYRLLHSELHRGVEEALASTASGGTRRRPRVMDAGCGVGGGMLWFVQHEPSWQLEGYTLSASQFSYITRSLTPYHKFSTYLRTYDEPTAGVMYDGIYSVEAIVHSPGLASTLKAWSHHLRPGGVITIIDDFLNTGSPLLGSGETDEIRGARAAYHKWWLGVALVSPEQLIGDGLRRGPAAADQPRHWPRV